MIFRQIAEIRDGRKTMTQRVQKQGEYAVYDAGGRVSEVRDGKGRLKWRVGGRYAIVPKRGDKGVGFIKVTAIAAVRVQEMNLMQAMAEGVGSVGEYRALWDAINDRKGRRWADNPAVWRIRFEVEP